MLNGFRMPEEFCPTRQQRQGVHGLRSDGVAQFAAFRLQQRSLGLVTVTDSVALPTSSAASTRMVCAA